MSSPLLPSAHLSFASILVLHIKPQPNCIKYPGRQIAFNLLEPEIAQLRLLRRHRNTPHGRTFVCVDKTPCQTAFYFWTPHFDFLTELQVAKSRFVRWPRKINTSAANIVVTETAAREHFIFWTTHLDFSGCLLLGSPTITGDPWSWGLDSLG